MTKIAIFESIGNSGNVGPFVGVGGPEPAEGPCPSTGMAAKKQHARVNILTIWGRIGSAKVIKFLL